MDPRERLFPYMFWAHTESFVSPYCLAQSALPMPDPDWLQLAGGELLGYPTAEAQPALEAKLGELFGLEPGRVLTTLGASGAMHLCAERWFRAGALVLTETPSYEPLRVLPERSPAAVQVIERKLDDQWTFDLELVERAVRDAHGPVHLFLTNPHNPSGAVIDGECVVALARAIEPTGGVLVACETYMEFATNETRVHAALLAPNAVSIGSLTKAYGLGALRVGWILLGAGLSDERDALIDHAYLTWIDPPTPSLVAGRKALDRLAELCVPMRRVEAESRPHLARWLAESDAVEGTLAPFGILAFPRVRGVSDTLGLQRFLARDFGVDVVAGEHFGAPGHIRVACGVPEATIVEGLGRLENGLRVFLERGTPATD